MLYSFDLDILILSINPIGLLASLFATLLVSLLAGFYASPVKDLVCLLNPNPINFLFVQYLYFYCVC